MLLNPRLTIEDLVGIAIALIVGITFHEFSHAWVADTLGDHRPRALNRVNLNPVNHIDPVGAIVFVLAGFGWGKPVPVDPRRLRWGRMGMAIVSIAGPASNVVLAILAAIVWRLGAEGAFALPDLGRQFLAGLVSLNVGLAVFNVLPVAPLDGFGVASAFLPRTVATWLARYGPVLLLILIGAPFIIGRDILGLALNPMRQALLAFVLQAAGAA
jgi:Zn-dependent protease